jgi:glycosyltransferase involved in cell wall biosynthesis
MRISVALCTFNGEKFIREQLQSILRQQRRPDEIVIFDDASSDATVSIAEATLQENDGAFPIHTEIHVNSENVGVTENFSRATQATTGELIFLCDQDDVWRSDKVARIAAEFERDPGLLLVHTDARLIDDSGSPLGVGLLDALELRADELSLINAGRAFEVLVRRNVVTGATCAFRRTLLAHALPFANQWIHDEWLAIVAAATGGLMCLSEPLTDYRQHASNQIGMQKRSFIAKIRHMFKKRGSFYRNQVIRADLLIRQLQTLPRAQERIAELNDWRGHLAFRANLPANRLSRLPLIRREIATGRYSRYSLGLRSVVRDALEAP